MEEVGTHQAPSLGKRPQARPPWNPTGIALISVLLSPLPGGVLHALNYDRLGQPKRRRLALTSNLITTTILFVAVFATPNRSHVLIWAASLFIAAYFYKSQDKLFREHKSAGGQTASLLVPGLLSVVVPVLLGISLSYVEFVHYRTELRDAVRLMKVGELHKAENKLREFQRANPDEMASYWDLALIYERTGDLDKAKHELRTFLVEHKQSREVQEYLDRLESKNH
jgi:hypothetical protein